MIKPNSRNDYSAKIVTDQEISISFIKYGERIKKLIRAPVTLVINYIVFARNSHERSIDYKEQRGSSSIQNTRIIMIIKIIIIIIIIIIFFVVDDSVYFSQGLSRSIFFSDVLKIFFR